MDYRFLSTRFYEMREQQLSMYRRAVTRTDQQVSQIVLDAALKC